MELKRCGPARAPGSLQKFHDQSHLRIIARKGTERIAWPVFVQIRADVLDFFDRAECIAEYFRTWTGKRSYPVLSGRSQRHFEKVESATVLRGHPFSLASSPFACAVRRFEDGSPVLAISAPGAPFASASMTPLTLMLPRLPPSRAQRACVGLDAMRLPPAVGSRHLISPSRPAGCSRSCQPKIYTTMGGSVFDRRLEEARHELRKTDP